MPRESHPRYPQHRPKLLDVKVKYFSDPRSNPDFQYPPEGSHCIIELFETLCFSGRLVSALPTIRFCIENGARSVVILSHMGRPGKQVSMQPVACELEKLLERLGKILYLCVIFVCREICHSCFSPHPHFFKITS